MEAISQGDSDRRINVDTKEQELLLVAETTNTMLDNMDKSIRDIYQLQLSQKDANLKACKRRLIRILCIIPWSLFACMQLCRIKKN